MKTKLFILAIFAISFCAVKGETRYVGGDISLMPDYEKAGAIYKDTDGKKIDALLPYFYNEGMRAMRVRLFVEPEDFVDNDPNACQSLPYIIPLCKEIVDNGFKLMLDFHYSDTWADPAAQWIPKSWENLSESELLEKIYSYTKETLETLHEEGITPDFIQTGNEISYGMLWSPYGAPESEQHKTFINSDANWGRLGQLLNNAIKACREVCPDAQIVIHTERVSQVDVQDNFYKKMKELDVNYDIIGLSYYPYFHGNMTVLDNALKSLEENFPEKQIMIVETGFPYKWEIPGTSEKVDYEYSEEGQDKFAQELVNTLLKYDHVTGLFWWWMEYNAYGTSLSKWYNAPLFNSLTGMATPALKTICSFGTADSGIAPIERDDKAINSWYDLNGRWVNNPAGHGIYISKGRKIKL